MSTIVFDIETLGIEPESYDASLLEYLLKSAATEEERQEEVAKMSLSPFTGEILAIGMVNPDTGGGRALYRADRAGKSLSEDGKIEFIAGSEKTILTAFWDDIVRYGQFVTFNGRTFDCPFLMLRSVLLGIRPARNLVPYRYSVTPHCDLLDQLTYYGATRRYNLDFYCKSFGIASPKSGGITGAGLGPLYRDGRYLDIAKYCIGDVIATAELYRRWNEFLYFR